MRTHSFIRRRQLVCIHQGSRIVAYWYFPSTSFLSFNAILSQPNHPFHFLHISMKKMKRDIIQFSRLCTSFTPSACCTARRRNKTSVWGVLSARFTCNPSLYNKRYTNILSAIALLRCNPLYTIIFSRKYTPPQHLWLPSQPSTPRLTSFLCSVLPSSFLSPKSTLLLASSLEHLDPFAARTPVTTCAYTPRWGVRTER